MQTSPASTPALTPRTNAHPLDWPGVLHWERVFALFLHISIVLHVLVLPALVMWLWRRKRSKFVDDHGRQTLNFQLTLLVYLGAGFLLSFPTCGGAPYVVVPAVYILGIVGTVLACIAARRGRVFRYPMTIPFLRSAV